jgi:hypothetical protein
VLGACFASVSEVPFLSISTQENFLWTENFPKISLLKVENFQLQNFFSDGKFVSANQIVQNVLSVENFPDWKLALLNICMLSPAKTRMRVDKN